MAETLRFDQPVSASFGGREIVIQPLHGLSRIRAFEQALIEEVTALDSRVRNHARANSKVSAEALLEAGVDEARLLKLGLPEIVDDALLEESTARERLGALTAICYANNLARFAPFLSLEALIEVASMMNLRLPEFPTPEPSGNSSELVLDGATSSAS